jgi:hypothetical protein
VNDFHLFAQPIGIFVTHQSHRSSFSDEISNPYIRFSQWVPVGDYMYYAHDIVAFDVPLTVETTTMRPERHFPWHINEFAAMVLSEKRRSWNLMS